MVKTNIHRIWSMVINGSILCLTYTVDQIIIIKKYSQYDIVMKTFTFMLKKQQQHMLSIDSEVALKYNFRRPIVLPTVLRHQHLSWVPFVSLSRWHFVYGLNFVCWSRTGVATIFPKQQITLLYIGHMIGFVA